MTLTKYRRAYAILQLIPTLLSAHLIQGIVVNEATRRPLEFVNVTVQNAADNTVVTGVVTEKNGAFTIKDVPDGEYFLRLSLIGYGHKDLPAFRLNAQRTSVNLGTITLAETSVNLEDVLVTGSKALFNTTIDRKVYNVEQDVISKSGSASELLQNIPSVEVDLEGNVSLRGSSNVLFMLNGKTSPLLGRSRATVLQQLPASSIEKIEVITNPSAKFNSEGTSGIINIVLKKDTDLGFNGSVNANAGNRDRYNGNVRLNFHPGDLGLYFGYGVRKDNRNRSNSDLRRQDSVSSGSTFYDQQMASYARPLSHMVSVGGDYRIDNSNSAGFAGSYFYNSFVRTERAVTLLQNTGGMETGNFERIRDDHEFERELGLTMNYEHAFPKEDHTLQLELKLSKQWEEEDNHYTNLYRFPSAPILLENTLIQPTEQQRELTVDYTNPLSDQSMFEAGYAGEMNTYDLNYLAELYDAGRQGFVADLTRTNRFILDETIHAAYATFRHSFGTLGFLGGVRAEQVFTTSNLVTRDSILTNAYFSIYPTLHLSYKISEAAELQLSYSRRTRRPEADELNPFPEYQDPRNISAGNPHLLPEYTHSVELGCQLQNDWLSVLPSLYYRSTFNRFTSVTQRLNDSTLLTTEENLAKDQSTGLEVIVSAGVNEIVTSHMSVSAFHSRIDASNIGYGNAKSTVTWTGAMTLNITPTATTMLQINANYSAARLTPQGERAPSYVFNVGARQDFLEKRLSLVLTIADVFKTVRRETAIDIPELHQIAMNKRDSQILYLGLTYNFGTAPRKSKEESLKYDNGL